MPTDTNWEERYRCGETGWNLHEPSPPLLHLMHQLPNEAKSWPILFPGAGESPDPAVWYAHGFEQVYVVDLSPTARHSFLSRHPNFPENQYLIQDFFTLQQPQWRLIVEQTFYCAIPPELRKAYAATMQKILWPEGELQGVWFDRTFSNPGPPFGGDVQGYIDEMQPFLTLLNVVPCLFSASPRAGTEVFMYWRPSPIKNQTTEGH